MELTAIEHMPAIIEQAAKSPLGLFALMVIALSSLGFFFFRGRPQAADRRHVYFAQMLMPYLHTTLHRMLTQEKNAPELPVRFNTRLSSREAQVISLVRDGMTNQQIAEGLDLTAATVSSRIRRMEVANKLRVVAVSDFRAHGYNVLMEVAIEVDNRSATDVAEELAELPEVFAAHLTTGRYDIDLLVVLQSIEQLPDLLLNKFGKIKGIRSMIPAIAVDVVKYQFDVAPIEARED